MPPVHVIEEELAPCGVEYTSLFAKKAKFRFFREGKEIAASPEVDLTGMLFKNASWKWKTLACADDELDYLATYKVDIDATPIAFAQEVHVWAKDITITAKDATSKAVVADVPFVVQGWTGGKPPASDSSGLLVVPVLAGQRPNVAVARPWFAKKWENGAGRKRIVEVERGCLVKLVFPASKIVHKQWVNLDADSKKPELGSKLVVKVAAPTEKDAAPGQKVYLKATFDAGNAARTPDSGGTEPGKDKSLEAVLDDKREATFVLELGPAGLDKIKITVGGTPDCADDETTVETWRKLFYELMAPDTMTLDAVTLPDSTAAEDLPSAMRGWFAARLGAAGVAYELKATHRFAATEGSVADSMFAATYLKRSGSNKLYVVSSKDDAPKSFGSPDARTIHVRLCDGAFSTGGKAPTKQTRRPILTSATLDFTTFDDYLFPKSMFDGTDAILVAGCVWTAQVTKTAYPSGHPGLTPEGNPLTGNVDKAWLNASDYATLRITLPTDSPPGSIVGALSATKCPIEIEIGLLTAYAINGNAGGGKQLLVFKPSFPTTNASTVCHELGHAMGMAVLGGKVDAPTGMTAPAEVPAGTSYDEHGHKGTHCATGLSATDKALASFASLQGSCIMFGGAADKEPASRSAYCASCLSLLKGRRLVDVTSTFYGRSGGAL